MFASQFGTATVQTVHNRIVVPPTVVNDGWLAPGDTVYWGACPDREHSTHAGRQLWQANIAVLTTDRALLDRITAIDVKPVYATKIRPNRELTVPAPLLSDGVFTYDGTVQFLPPAAVRFNGCGAVLQRDT